MSELRPDASDEAPQPPATVPSRKRRSGLRRAVTIGIAVFVGAGWLGQALYLRPLERMPVHTTPAKYGMPEFRDVTIETDQGRRNALTLNAWYLPGARPETIILCHGRGDSRVGLLPIMHMVHTLGYSTLAMEFRAHGDSEGTWSTIGAAEQRDVTAALNWVDTNGSGPVAVFG